MRRRADEIVTVGYHGAVPRSRSHLDPKKRYLQVALNSTLAEARQIIAQLPASDRIIIEAGTPLIKRHGIGVVSELVEAYAARLAATSSEDDGSEAHTPSFRDNLRLVLQIGSRSITDLAPIGPKPYVVADLKTMDRGATEVEMAAAAGASAVVALGTAPVETLNEFVAACERLGLDAMVDMMNAEYPVGVLRSLRRPPPIVILHRGVDEEQLNKQKQLPLHEIRRLKGSYDVLIAVAGGDTVREVQRATFNDADIVVVWKSVYSSTADTVSLVEGFLKEIR